MILASVKGADIAGATKRLERIEFRLTGRDPSMFQDIQQIVYQSTAVNFASQGRPHWKARKKPQPWPILAKSGKLLRTVLESITRPWKHRGISHHLEVIGPLNEKGYPYGHKHQYGWGIVARPFLKLMADERTKIQRRITRAFTKET